MTCVGKSPPLLRHPASRDDVVVSSCNLNCTIVYLFPGRTKYACLMSKQCVHACNAGCCETQLVFETAIPLHHPEVGRYTFDDIINCITTYGIERAKSIRRDHFACIHKLKRRLTLIELRLPLEPSEDLWRQRSETLSCLFRESDRLHTHQIPSPGGPSLGLSGPEIGKAKRQ